MKHLSELRTMIDEFANTKNAALSQDTRPVTISGDYNVIVVYAAGPVTINNAAPPPTTEDDTKTPG